MYFPDESKQSPNKNLSLARARKSHRHAGKLIQSTLRRTRHCAGVSGEAAAANRNEIIVAVSHNDIVYSRPREDESVLCIQK